MFKIHSLRFRIAFAYIVGALLVSGLVALSTYTITSIVLTRQTIQSARSQSFDEVRFLQGVGVGQQPLLDLLNALARRGTAVLLTSDVYPPSSTDLGITDATIPEPLRRAVERDGAVGDMTFQGPEQRLIVFGTPVPGTEPQLHAYFVYPLGSVDRTLSVLWRVLVGVVAVAGSVAGAVGLRLADRTIRPLRAAAVAARRVAEGNLETRLEETGEDELARLAQAFNRMTHALEERIGRERRFVSDVSHELRTPLTALKTSIDVLAERIEEFPQRLRLAVGLAAEEVRSLQRLVDDLLELSRAEAGGVHVSADDVDLLAFTTQLVRRRAPDAPVRIEGKPIVVRTDKSRLERVVGNLVENAVMHGGGADVEISVERKDHGARIVVADRGPGISQEMLPRIFERFWRGDASRRRDGRVGA
ncbi:MAG: histidine kinase dimerization/phospho-acceptor domain-containing protein, partial [Candidatus Binatia bacterium]